MEYQKYFACVIEFSQLLCAYRAAPEHQRPALMQRIQNTEYLVQMRREQTFSERDFASQLNRGRQDADEALLENAGFNLLTKKLKHDFFIDMAVPTRQEEDGPEQIKMPLHRHNYLEMIFVLKGQYIQYINGVRHEHDAGSFCLLNPNVVHHDVPIGPEDVVFFFCLGQNYVYRDLLQAFTPHPKLKSFMEYQLGRSSQQYILFHPSDAARVEELVAQILQENYEKQPGHHMLIEGLLVRLFSVLVNSAEYEVYCQNAAKTEEYLVGEIIYYIKQHLNQVTRAETAAYFHFNPDYLNRVLERATGRCYSAYVRDLRLAEAALRLKSGDLSVNRIIRELGFSNKGYFNRIFKERYGVLPGEYRKQ